MPSEAMRDAELAGRQVLVDLVDLPEQRGRARCRPSSRHLLDAASRARTSANSAATKKPFSATSTSDAEQEQQLGHRGPRLSAWLLRGGSSSLMRRTRRT